MTSTPRDENRIPALFGSSSSDGKTPVILYVDPITNRLIVNATITGTLAPPSTIVDGSKNVTSAGTAVPLVLTTACKRVDITAKLANTGVIVVGASTVVASASTRRGIPLNAGDSYSLEISDPSLIYIDATVNGEGVTFVYYN